MTVPTTLPGERAWTAEQAAAIARRDGELLLDAGAGSGKTAVLVERFVRHVLEDGIAVGAILAITFTEKAAAELRDRIRARLHELGAVEPARATEGAFISTIHGFCARVLRAGALAAGLDPEFVVLDRNQSERLASAAFDAALSDLEPDRAADLVAAYGAGPLRNAILGVYARLRSAGQLRPELPPAVAPDTHAARLGLIAGARALAAELGAIASPGSSVIQALDRLERCLELTDVADLWPAELDRIRLPGNGAALSTDACTAYREALAAYRAVCAARAAGPVRDVMDALLRAFAQRYAQAKGEVSGVDFEDLELLTLELLATRPELRQRYTERFERIMVDEQQDTNRVQLELIETIAGDNLFTVGDAQQSIYRFRHADVSLFEQRGVRLRAAGRRLTLQTNFRSRPEILETVNTAFASVLGERYAPLVPGRAPLTDGVGEPRVELLLVDKGATWELEGLAAPWRLAEARALGDRIAALVAAGTAPGDIVVLTRATTDMRAYERALEASGLPTYVIGGRGYWSHPQVLDLVAYLRALANPRDEEALYGVLASPLVGASFDALVVLAGVARARRCDPWSALAEPGPDLDVLDAADRDALADFAHWFAAERARAPRSGVEALIDRVLDRTGYEVSMLSLPGGRRRLANIRKLMRLGREFEAEHGLDLRGFLQMVADRAAGRDADPRESEAPLEGEGLDAIRLMTIHRAKGLEWPVVCVADLGRSPRPIHQILRVSNDGRLGLRLSRPGTPGRVSALDYVAILDEERRADEDEERRLFYVAMTRARERLILSGATRFDGWTGAVNANGGGPVAWIAPALVPELGRLIGEGGGDVACGTGRVRLRIPDAESIHAQPVAVTPAEAVVPLAAPVPVEPLPVSPAGASLGSAVTALSYSALSDYARCGYRFYAERVLRLPPPAGEDTARDGPSASERGVLLHALLERLPFRRPVLPAAEAVDAAAVAAGLSPPGPDQTRELITTVQRFAASDLCGRLSGLMQTRREERFAFPLGEGPLVTGVFDVIAREPDDRTLIVDYKSDRLGAGEPEALAGGRYGLQRLVYALAALHAGARQVEVVHCFLERPEQPAVAVYDAADRDRLQADLEARAAGVLREEFAVAEVPRRDLCRGCPAEGGLCSWPLAMTRREAVDRLF